MGLLDILNSIQGGGGSNDPRAPSAQAGMSPMAKALLALLAVYAAKKQVMSAAEPVSSAYLGWRITVATKPNGISSARTPN